MRAERGNSGPKRQRGGSLTAFLALQTQSDFLGNLGLLVEDGLGLIAKKSTSVRREHDAGSSTITHLTTETGLLSVVTTLTLREEGSLASLAWCVSIT